MTILRTDSGTFVEQDYGNRYWYNTITADTIVPDWVRQQGYTHIIEVTNSLIRYALIYKTVAYVCVDEDSYGNGINEKWSIK